MDHVFPFETDEIGPDLDLMPLAARRALDHAGLHLPLDGWRSLRLEVRQCITSAGTLDDVDVSLVASLVEDAVPVARTVAPVSDPTPTRLPAGLSAEYGIDLDLWELLGGLARYVITHAARRAANRKDPSILKSALDIFAPRLTMPSPDPKSISVHLPASISTHIGPTGDVRMVDVADKPTTNRRAVATSRVRMKRETVERLMRGDTPKGEVLATARIAGIMAAKRTPEIIPMCHAIALSHVEISIDVDEVSACALITAKTEAVDRTGVEMEAMVAASVAALTIYDMLKGIDREMVVEHVALMEKTGGRSGHFKRST